jgi:1-acyl-sn-glycerol-3-phosphate acyltransferase
MGLVRDEEALVSVHRGLRRTVRIGGFGALTAVMLPAFLVHRGLTPAGRRTGVRERWVATWSGALLRMFGLRLNTQALPSLEPGRGHLIVANHRSTADILMLLRAFGGHMVSRDDVARWPLVGVAARSVGTVFVDRSDAVSGATAVRTIRGLLAGASNVIVFPEGTTFAGDEVRPFRGGAFIAALRSGADVVPVGLAYQTGSGASFVNESFGAHLWRMAAAEPSRVAMCVGDPIALAQDTRAGDLRDRAHEAVQELVREARAVVDRR